MKHRLLLCAWISLAIAGCFEHVTIGEGSGQSGLVGQGGNSADAAQGGSTAGAPGDAAEDAWTETGTGGQGDGAGGTPGTGQACGLAVCSSGTECCYLTAKCFDPKNDPLACQVPLPDADPGKPCGADSHCAAGEYCRNDNDFMCMGKGRCAPRTPASCALQVTNLTCACDGVTRSEVDSCLLGVRVLGSPATVGCGKYSPIADRSSCGNNSAYCTNGWVCCGITGLCYDPAVPELCTFPPQDTYLPCVDKADCPQGSGFCQGPVCNAPGGCIHIPSSCPGVEAHVCGCDGNTYTSRCDSSHEGVAVKSFGDCDDGGT